MDFTEQYKQEIVPIILRHIPHCTIYLFGSRASGQQHAGSDIDIAIDAGLPIDRDIMLDILTAIDASSIPVFIDMIDIYRAPEHFKQEILNKGVIWSN